MQKNREGSRRAGEGGGSARRAAAAAAAQLPPGRQRRGQRWVPRAAQGVQKGVGVRCGRIKGGMEGHRGSAVCGETGGHGRPPPTPKPAEPSNS